MNVFVVMYTEDGGWRYPPSVLHVAWAAFRKHVVRWLHMPQSIHVIAFALSGWWLSSDRGELPDWWEWNAVKSGRNLEGNYKKSLLYASGLILGS